MKPLLYLSLYNCSIPVHYGCVYVYIHICERCESKRNKLLVGISRGFSMVQRCRNTTRALRQTACFPFLVVTYMNRRWLRYTSSSLSQPHPPQHKSLGLSGMLPRLIRPCLLALRLLTGKRLRVGGTWFWIEGLRYPTLRPP